MMRPAPKGPGASACSGVRVVVRAQSGTHLRHERTRGVTARTEESSVDNTGRIFRTVHRRTAATPDVRAPAAGSNRAPPSRTPEPHPAIENFPCFRAPKIIGSYMSQPRAVEAPPMRHLSWARPVRRPGVDDGRHRSRSYSRPPAHPTKVSDPGAAHRC